MTKIDTYRRKALGIVVLLAVIVMALDVLAAEPAKTETQAADPEAKEAATPPPSGQAPMEFRTYKLWEEPAGIALIGYSVVGVALILERLLAWAAVGAASRWTAAQIKDLLTTPDRAQMLAAFQESKSPLGRVMASVLENGVTNSPETTQLLMENSLDSVERRLKRNLALLACVAGTAPFMGLLGTVFGIMDTFNSIAKEGFGGPAVISHGIGQALITTAGGLAVAIPTFIAYNLFIAKANNKIGELREQASRIFVALGDM